MNKNIRLLIIAASIFIASAANAIPTISFTTVNLRHFGWDPAFPVFPVTETEGWDIAAEVHLAGDISDPAATNVSVSGPTGSMSLDYLPWFYPIFGEYSYFGVVSVDPLEISLLDGDYEFQVEGGPSQTHTIPDEAFRSLVIPVTTWDPSTGLLSWGSVPYADSYQVLFMGYDEATDSIYGTDLICQGVSTTCLLPMGTEGQIVSVQAFDVDSQLVLVNQSQYFTYVPEPSTALLLAGGLVGLAAAGRRRL